MNSIPKSAHTIQKGLKFLKNLDNQIKQEVQETF